MKIEVFFTLPQVGEETIREDTAVVVIDVLRATTSICHALAAGCDKMIPVGDLGQVTAFVESLGRGNCLIGGERDGKKISGFDFGNSPAEYTPEAVAGSDIIFLTTNGSRIISRFKNAPCVLIASLANLQRVVDFLADHKGNVVICCAGSKDQFCLEDSVCAGLLVERLLRSAENIELNDAARVGLVLAGSYSGDLLTCFRECSHGQTLIRAGFESDLELCAAVDTLDVLPFYSKERITLQPEVELPLDPPSGELDGDAADAAST